MEDIESNSSSNLKVGISFPSSSEDHRLQLIGLNGSVFAILHAPLESDGPIRLLCDEWSLILLAPIKSKSNVVISGINVICLNEIASEEGFVNLHAAHRLVKFKGLIRTPNQLSEMGQGGKIEFDDETGSLLNYYRLLGSAITNIRTASPESIAQAQQQFILILSMLADKIESKNLDLKKVLNIWNVPCKI